MALTGTQYTVTATATRPFALAAGAPRVPVQEISFKAPGGNTGTVYIGNSNVTTSTNILIEVTAGTGFTSGPFDNGPIYLDDFYVVGTANDRLFIYAVPR